MSDCSYAVYLFHGFVLSILGSWILGLAISEGLSRKGAVALMSLSVVVIVYPLSWIIFKYVEQPGISLGKRLTGSRTGSRRPVEVEIASRSVAQKPPSMSRSLKSK
jgi:peptidoglycan/LPS O-acetylase OafA/YrhL